MACGARSDIDVRMRDAGAGGATATTSTTSATATTSASTSGTTSTSATSSTSSGGCVADEDCDDGVGCTVDLCAGGLCTAAPADALCDDGFDCTKDSCDAVNDCAHAPVDALCNDVVGCTADFCVPGVGCTHEPCDEACSDGSFCNGLERCDVQAGCKNAAPPCNDGIACTIDSCSGAGDGTCGHTVPNGCLVPSTEVLVVGASGELASVSVALGTQSSSIPAAGPVYLDIARVGVRVFGCDGTTIYEIDPATNKVIGAVASSTANSLGGSSDGFLYYADNFLSRVSPDTGAKQTLAPLPYGHVSSGDVAILGGHAFITTTSACGYDSLVDVDLATGASFVVGKIPTPCVYGLVALSGELIGLSCEGHIARIDPETGASTIVSTTIHQMYGGAGPEG